jgi:hypothetical protein
MSARARLTRTPSRDSPSARSGSRIMRLGVRPRCRLRRDDVSVDAEHRRRMRASEHVRSSASLFVTNAPYRKVRDAGRVRGIIR